MPAYKWHYPEEIANDLQSVDLPPSVKAEVFACAWEYSRCVIPHYTNWKRYVAFMRIIIIGTIAEFKGSLFDMTADDDNMLGYSLNQVLYDLFEDTAGAKNMAREYKTFLTVTSDKTSDRQHDQFFRSYIKAVPSGPANWFRLGDCDALCRFTIAAALVCNDIDDVWFDNEQWNVLAEIGDTLYDAIAFYKHRAEGETNNTFAYMPEGIREEAFRNAREVLWAMDTAYAKRPEWQVIINMIRFFGGPIHMMMRRYRFVEEGLVIGKSEDENVQKAAKKHEKLWHRLELDQSRQQAGQVHFDRILDKQDAILFEGFVDILNDGNRQDSAMSSPTIDGEAEKRFGGALLSDSVREQWREYALGLNDRVLKAFPEVVISPALPTEVRSAIS
ncbi:Alpha-ionylideneethane synthase aba3 [Fulvia fulva]|uniref:Alpha-ionylideneethane synthase aba3 n=1 Tax=Passalora fulva TaxID=5499 RepID=A0A9Q8P973_PASFU|nr:Alpha-ionylideneethane synthase aba3 [Fulvia fulva]KAK4623793.1 Alpha-ionylideneethane synthase aba3 [Fulvia fulva]KAK4625212.1 Alpha-ionylideneethane synthase aba3 [Fulvia fulva]UJO17969.1 Alpha-ionylideneethane synthase aba3 [Fulvia fulva]WPV15286.1 Alpha-ionylideneethane synthase aba3 [Fulvia fulva]WPV29447.1 Alpha-ionylideneethane synthase aba3 [Fulvia fulva]